MEATRPMNMVTKNLDAESDCCRPVRKQRKSELLSSSHEPNRENRHRTRSVHSFAKLGSMPYMCISDLCSLNGMSAKTDSTSRSMKLPFQIAGESLSDHCSSALTNRRTTANLVGLRRGTLNGTVVVGRTTEDDGPRD